MEISEHLKIAFILTVGFSFASIFGYLAHLVRFSPLIGYLVAGYFIGPYSPGFVADVSTAEQLAEIGVILMMFGVGLHFKWQDLVNVKNIAIPGALGQTLIATLIGAVMLSYLGWSLEAGVVVGLSVAVASTVVLVRVLMERDLLRTSHGHIAIGWLIVEDLLTVVALLLLPTLAAIQGGSSVSFQSISYSIFMIFFKFLLMSVIILTAGKWLVSFSLFRIARMRSNELLTITILALLFLIAIGSTVIFQTSIALGAFMAGMVIGQTVVRHQALANALPLKDTFAVVFFLSVGMLFNPSAIHDHFFVFLSILFVILICKPLTAFVIIIFLKYPLKTALIVAAALAQIGEFSFILAEEAMHLNILPEEGYDIIVACAIISIALNPALFNVTDWFNGYLEKRSGASLNEQGMEIPAILPNKAIVIGFGPIGQKVVQKLDEKGFQTVIVDQNIDTIEKIKKSSMSTVYGDASSPHILETAHLEEASLLVITPPDIKAALSIIKVAREINPFIKILARTRYGNNKKQLADLMVRVVCCEEETSKAFIEQLSLLT